MEYEMISEKELDRLLEKEQGFVIDLRSPWEYAAYHIPGAVNIPYERLKKVRGLPKNVPLIFYCERGSVSMVAAREMAEKGYRAKSLTGGIHSWHRRLGKRQKRLTGKNSKIIVNKQEENSEKGLKRQLFFCLEMQSEKEKENIRYEIDVCI